MKGIEKSSRVMGLRRFSMGQLLIALALLFFFVPFVEEIKGGDLIVSALLSLVLLAGVLAVASRGRTLTIALLLAIPAVAGRWINHFQPHLVPSAIFLVAGIGLVAFVVINLLRFVLRASSVDGEVLCASISGLPDARFDLDDGLLARGAVDTRSLRVQHDHWNERDNGRFQCLL